MAQLVEHFGERIVDGESGEVNRKALGPIVFADPAELQALNAIVWPAIREMLRKELASLAAAAETRVAVVEAAVLLEAGWDDLMDEVWAVVIPPDTARDRLMARNGLSAEDAEKRISAQMSNEEREAKAKVVLRNDADEPALREAARSALGALRERHAGLSAA